VLCSVAASRAALELVTADDLAEFVAAWRYDQFHWNARLHMLPNYEKLTEALTWLGIADVHVAGGAEARR
jgi:hypothetical protein